MVHHQQSSIYDQFPNAFKFKTKKTLNNFLGKDLFGQRPEDLNRNILEWEFKTVKTQKAPEDISVTIIKIDDEKCFHQVIYPVLFLAQMFGLFPVYGIQSKTAKDLKFNIFSIKFVYSLFVSLSVFTLFMITMVWFFNNRIGFGKFGIHLIYKSTKIGE